jgi:alkylhydroperoxidase family enzyme
VGVHPTSGRDFFNHGAILIAAAGSVASVSGTSGPRIPPLPASEQDEQQRELLSGVRVTDAPASNIFATLVRHPGLFRRWLPFGGKLLAGKLPARDRELLILRTAHLCHAEYEWGQHRLIGLSSGISEAEIDDVRLGSGADGWEPFDAALLTAADELHETARISDVTWDILAARYDDRQLIEVPMVVGHYHMVAFTLNSLGVELEPGVAGFGASAPRPT